MAQVEKVVVDASVVVKWFTFEEYSEQALEIRRLYERGSIDLLAPSLLPYEVGNALKYNPGFGSEEVSRALHDLEEMQITLYLLEGELRRLSSELAFAHALSFYDSAYVALAANTHSTYYTADEEVVSRVAKPFVRRIEAVTRSPV